MVPYSPDGQDGSWELKEVAYIRSDVFDALAAKLGYECGRIPGIEPDSNGKVWPSVVPSAVRQFHFQTFVATRSEQEIQKLVGCLPFLRHHVETARRCMTGGDEQVKFLRGTGSLNALSRPSVAC